MKKLILKGILVTMCFSFCVILSNFILVDKVYGQNDPAMDSFFNEYTQQDTTPTPTPIIPAEDLAEYEARQNTGKTGLIECSGEFTNGVQDCNIETFFGTITEILKYIYITAFSIATILFAYAGILFMTAQGDSGKIDTAKGIFKSVIIGLVIMALSYWLVLQLLQRLGVGTEFYRFLSN